MSKIISANLLLTGEVVYLGPSHQWVTDIDQAVRFAKDDAPRWRTVTDQAVAKNYVVDVAEIDLDGASDAPVRLREKIRALGPTVHPAFARHKTAKAA